MQVAETSAPEAAMQELFCLSQDENLVDSFACKLQQTYSCSHNSYTPAIQMMFSGTLSITDRHVCFCIEERGKKLPFKFAHVSVKSAVSSGKGGTGSTISVALKDGTKIVLKDFASVEMASNALALIEHLALGS